MLVTPVPRPLSLSTDWFAARIRGVIDNTEGKLRQAVEALVWRLAVHPSQMVGSGTRYTELSVGYIAQAAGVGRETARRAWHLLRERLGWVTLSLGALSVMGVQARRLADGAVWGQHMLITTDAADAAELVMVERGLGSPRTALPDGPGWRELHPVHRGRHLMACCPWHDDHTPSMLLNPNEDGHSGSGICFACLAEGGGPLRVYWREHEGVYRVRLARGVVHVHGAIRGVGTIENLEGRCRRADPLPCTTAPHTTHRTAQPADTPAAGPGLWRHMLGMRDETGGMRRSQSRCADLTELIRHAERRSLTDSACRDAAWRHAMDAPLGDAYVSVEPMRPSAWRTMHTRRGDVYVPDRWEPVVVQWVLADLDGFEDGPIGDRELADAGRAVEQWAHEHPELSGRVIIVRTSHLGVQVAVELAQPRRQPRLWYRTDRAYALMVALDHVALVAVRDAGFVGGHADQAVHAAGRLMRRPGWRVDKAGCLCRSRLVFASTI